ncbi:MAG: NADH-quinone oxidoreductase subunit M, partial [Pseudomonadota bacterium]
MGNILSLTIFLPLLGATILAIFLRGDDDAAQSNAKWVALVTTSTTFVSSLFIITNFDPADTGFQLVEQRDWILGLQYKVGVDGVSVLFVMLTTFLMPLVIGACWDMRQRVKEYMIAFMLLETMLLGAFLALDIVLFYLFAEACLIPVFLIIGIWGGAHRVQAGFKFFLLALCGSAAMLLAFVAMFDAAGSTDVAVLLDHSFDPQSVNLAGSAVTGGLQTLLWLALFAAFAIKMALWPLHTWFPDAEEQAPSAGSIVMAALLAKVGGYGLLRFLLPMLPVGTEVMAPFVLTLAAVAIVYAALVALLQDDMKKVIAYGAVAHMGYVTMGVVSLNQQGLDGAIFHLISHSLIVTALFVCMGALHHRMETTQISAFGGITKRMPSFALTLMFFLMASAGLPGTAGFVGPFLSIVGVFQVNTWVAVAAAVGIVLSGAYAVGLFRRVMFGDLIKESLK